MRGALIVILACRITPGGMFLCRLPVQRGSLQVVVDSGSNVSLFPGIRHKIKVLDENGRTLFHIKPAVPSQPVVQNYNQRVGPRDRISGIIGEDVLQKFRHVTFDFRRKTLELRR